MDKKIAKRRLWPWWLTPVIVIVLASKTAKSDPQINLLNKGCSQYNATNRRSFFDNLNATFADIRSQLLNGDNKHFATSQQAKSSDPVYAMVQCRNYLSSADCIACYDAAASQIRNCSAANGARVVFDGCFLRYESNNFYDQTTLPGNLQLCSNQTTSQQTSFESQAQTLLNDLQIATPKINGYFAAVKSGGSGGGAPVYAVAQCAETVSEKGCEDCLSVAYGNIQNCLPNSYGRAVDAGCFMRYSNAPFFGDNQTTDITPFLSGISSNTKAIIGGVVGGIGLLLVLLALFIFFRLSRKRKASQRGNILDATELQGPLHYEYKDLKDATKCFSDENKLGEGGFGEVFKGTLKNGYVVAVKKLTVSSKRKKEEFNSEVRLISNVHHRNLIRLLGCSSKGSDLLLVYEYMANGSLDRFLYGDKRGILNWKKRYDIIFGTARGLAYLHDQFHPKIADFGLARLMPEDRSHLTTRFAGTLGYTAPEYALHGHLSEKVDAYSFGVVILEIISGRRSSDMTDENTADYLLEKAWKLYESDMHLSLVDEALDSNEYNPEIVKKVIEISLACTQSPPSLRPTMSEVVVMLSSDHSLVRRPTRTPTLIDSNNETPVGTSTSGTSSNSNATASFTDVIGR